MSSKMSSKSSIIIVKKSLELQCSVVCCLWPGAWGHIRARNSSAARWRDPCLPDILRKRPLANHKWLPSVPCLILVMIHKPEASIKSLPLMDARYGLQCHYSRVLSDAIVNTFPARGKCRNKTVVNASPLINKREWGIWDVSHPDTFATFIPCEQTYK